MLQGREMPPGGQTPFSCRGGAVRPASPSGVALSFPCVPSPEVRALSRRAAFLERVLCSPCQAGRPRGAGGAVMECFLPTCSEDRVDSPDPGHSARRVLSPAEARRGWVTFGRGTTGSGRRRKASGPPGCWWPAASPHVSGGRGRRRRACPCGRLGRRRVLRVSCALRSVHHLPAAAPPGPAGTAACRCRPEDSPAGGAGHSLRGESLS